MRSSWTGRVAVSLAGIFVVGTGLAGAGGGRSAWEALVARDPGVVDDERVGWEERVALAVLTPEQAVEYRRGTDPGRLILEDGRTLGEYLEARLAPKAGVYVGLSAPCSLFSGEWWPSGAIREVAVRGRCGIPEEALAAVLELQVETLSPHPARVKVWARDLPEPAGASLEGEANSFAASLRATTIVNLCAGEWCEGDLRIRSGGEALLEARAVGYFRPLSAADVSTPVVSFSFEGEHNNFFGIGAGANNLGLGNSFFGGYAGNEHTTGVDNSFFGFRAGFKNTTASGNAFFGSDAGWANTTAARNSFFGYRAGFSNTASDNSFFGYAAGYANTTGANNAFFGESAGSANTTGGSNAFFGESAGYTNTGGGYNAFVGRLAGYFNTVGSSNAFVGYTAGYSNTSGTNNAFVGRGAGHNNTAGSGNAFFGWGAGLSNTIEHNNSFVGSSANGAAGITNATALGNRAQVSHSNSLVLGSIAGLNGATTSVNVGIGIAEPQRQLHMKGNNAVFRMDRDTDTAAFMIVRTNAAGTPLKSFVVGTNAFGPGNGEFIVNDLGAAVGGAGTRRMTITNAGETHFTGIVRAPSFVSTSSLRFKENVEPLRNAAEVVGQLRGVSFLWKETGKPSVGLIAEEVAEVLPQVVDWEENGLDAAGVNYSALVAVLIEAVKTQRAEHQAELASLRTRMNELESERTELVSLRARLADIEKLLVGGPPRAVAERK